MPEWASFTGEGYWIWKVFVLIFLTMVVNFLLKKFYDRLEVKFANTKNAWDDAFLASAREPSRYFVWVQGMSAAVGAMAVHTESEYYQYFEPIKTLANIFIVSWFLVRFIREAESNLLKPGYTNEPMDETTILAISKLLRASVIITSALVALQTFGYSVSGVLAFGGIGGIAVGFAAKDLLANFFGGLMIFMDRPFSVGDWIRSSEKQIEGTVEHIGWRLTTIRTFDKRPLYVPNSIFTSISVENPSRMTNRRIYETIGVRYCDFSQVGKIVEDIKEMLRNHPEIDNDQTMIVNFNSFGPSSLDFFVYTFTKTTEWIKFHEIKQDVLFRIMELIEAKGAQVAFPTSTVHLVRDEKPKDIDVNG